jgi:hypothetical protein
MLRACDQTAIILTSACKLFGGVSDHFHDRYDLNREPLEVRPLWKSDLAALQSSSACGLWSAGVTVRQATGVWRPDRGARGTGQTL